MLCRARFAAESLQRMSDQKQHCLAVSQSTAALLGRFPSSGSQRRSREDDLDSALMRRNGTIQEEALADFHGMTAFTIRQHST